MHVITYTVSISCQELQPCEAEDRFRVIMNGIQGNNVIRMNEHEPVYDTVTIRGRYYSVSISISVIL